MTKYNLQNRYRNEMTSIFESLEYRLYEKLEQADFILSRISAEASSCQIPAEFREKFVREKLIDMFDQIAERREAPKGGNAQKSAI
ncbi:hypothetical protein D3C73_387990 [compost metagenome]